MNFSYETNFHQGSSFNNCIRASNQNFETFLYFLLVDNVQTCKDRVDQRYEEGGHYVDHNTIDSRYINGLKNLNIAHKHFDNVLIFNTSKDYQVDPVLNIKHGELANLFQPIPKAVQEYLMDIASLIK
jgi:predicted ABC-type ATPase